MDGSKNKKSTRIRKSHHSLKFVQSNTISNKFTNNDPKKLSKIKNLLDDEYNKLVQDSKELGKTAHYNPGNKYSKGVGSKGHHAGSKHSRKVGSLGKKFKGFLEMRKNTIESQTSSKYSENLPYHKPRLKSRDFFKSGHKDYSNLSITSKKRNNLGLKDILQSKSKFFNSTIFLQE